MNGISTNKWMEHLYNNVENWKKLKLTEICLIGTNNSGTGCMGYDDKKGTCEMSYPNFINKIKDSKIKKFIIKKSWNFVQPIFKNWSKTQFLPIINQIEDGVRYIDINPWFADDGYIYFHKDYLFFYNEHIKKQLYYIKKFLEKNKKEIILISFTNYLKEIPDDFKKNVNNNQICDMVGEIFGNLLVDTMIDINNDSIEEIMKNGRVIAFVEQSCKIDYFTSYDNKYFDINNHLHVFEKNIKLYKNNIANSKKKRLEYIKNNLTSTIESENNELKVVEAFSKYNKDIVFQKFSEIIKKINFHARNQGIHYNNQFLNINVNISKWILDNINNKNEKLYNLNIILLNFYKSEEILGTIIYLNKIKARYLYYPKIELEPIGEFKNEVIEKRKPKKSRRKPNKKKPKKKKSRKKSRKKPKKKKNSTRKN